MVKIQRRYLDEVALMVDDLGLWQEVTFKRFPNPLSSRKVLHRITLREEPLVRLDHPLGLLGLHEVWACKVEVRAGLLDQNIGVTGRRSQPLKRFFLLEVSGPKFERM